VGSISDTITLHRRSPRKRAATRKSRLRIESAWARSCRAPYDPPGHNENGDQDRVAPVFRVGSDHDDQRESRYDQENVSDQGQEVIADTAHVGGGYAEDHR
jgi:hypothetical protein